MELKVRTLSKGDVFALLANLRGQAELIGSVKRYGRDLFFEELRDPKEVFLGRGHSLSSPLKRYLYPQKQDLFHYLPQNGTFKLEPLYEERKRIIFGVRSCDVAARKYLDKFFLTEFEDPYYLKRRENTTFISLSCLEPQEETCFCPCCDGGPSLKEGYDLQLTDIGDKYLAEIGSPKGEEVVEQNEEFFPPASGDDIAAKEKALEGVDQKFEITSYMAWAIRKITRGEIPEEKWEEISKRCISCCSCVYVCPNCTCFNVVDISDSERGTRVMTWDACRLSGYSRMVSGENPRAQIKERCKRWFYHKLSYLYFLRNERIGCVGCGRCIMACPTKIDMSNVVNELRGKKLELE